MRDIGKFGSRHPTSFAGHLGVRHDAAPRWTRFVVLIGVVFCLCGPLPQGANAGDLPPPLTDADFAPVNRAEAELGQLLFFDPILSGNRNISCATCHHPRLATGDGLSLGIGEGGIGLGPDRRPDLANMPEQLIPRNAQPLFNMGARQVRVLFHDGRIEVDPDNPSGLRTPLDDDMVTGFANLLSAQTMFPVLSPDEMAGHYQENDVATAVRRGLLTDEGGAWDIIASRVSALSAYREMFAKVYPEIAEGRPIRFTDISNAIAAFVAFEWRSDRSPFDAVLRGEASLPPDAERGLRLFFGKAGCADCHSGPLLTDQDFHAMGQPQLGPGKAERFETHRNDIGRMRVTGRPADAFSFRTPSLRNVMRTGPWGHAGAFSDMRDFLVHHAAPRTGLDRYDPQAVLVELDGSGSVWTIMGDDDARAAISAAIEKSDSPLDGDEIDNLLAFLDSLTDETALGGRLGVPHAVPSGLDIER